MNNIFKNLKNNLIKRGGSGRSRFVSKLSQAILAASLGFALAACEEMTGLSENINNAGSEANASAILSLNDVSPPSFTYFTGSDNPVLSTSASLVGATGKVKFQWYKIGLDGTDVPLGDPEIKDPETLVTYTPDVSTEGQNSYYVVANYPATGTASLESRSSSAEVVVGLPKVQLRLTTISPREVTYLEGQEQPQTITIAVSSLIGATAGQEVRFDLYRIVPGAQPVLCDTNTGEPLKPVNFTPPPPQAIGEKYSYFVEATYPAEGDPWVKIRSGTSVVTTNFEEDTDEDGYPDAWEIEHRDEGYNPLVADLPYGIDLSRKGKLPDDIGVTLDTSGPGGKYRYTVDGNTSNGKGIKEYRVYNSNDEIADVEYIRLENVAVDSDPRHRPNMTLYISDDVKDLYLDSNSIENGGNILIKARSADQKPLTITLYNLILTGGTPIDLEPSAQPTTLLLAGTNTLKGGTVYDYGTDLFLGSAGIHVPPGATLIIDKYPEGADHILNVTGGGGGNLYSWGAGAGIGGGCGRSGYTGGAAAGKITIQGGTVNATGGSGNYLSDINTPYPSRWGDGAGIGGGGNWGGPGDESPGEIIITGDATTVNATGMGTAAGIGNGADSAGGSITISEGAVVIAQGGNIEEHSAGHGIALSGRSSLESIKISKSNNVETAPNVTAIGGTGGGTGGSGNGIFNEAGDIEITGPNTKVYAKGGTATISGGGIVAGRSSVITITDAEVTALASGYYSGAGIGAGVDGVCGTIIINGSKVEATGGQGSAGIGSSQSSLCGNITISGCSGSVTGGFNPYPPASDFKNAIGPSNYAGDPGGIIKINGVTPEWTDVHQVTWP